MTRLWILLMVAMTACGGEAGPRITATVSEAGATGVEDEPGSAGASVVSVPGTGGSDAVMGSAGALQLNSSAGAESHEDCAEAGSAGSVTEATGGTSGAGGAPPVTGGSNSSTAGALVTAGAGGASAPEEATGGSSGAANGGSPDTGDSPTTGGTSSTGGTATGGTVDITTGGSEPDPWEIVPYVLTGSCSPDLPATDDLVFRTVVPHDGVEPSDCSVVSAEVTHCHDGACYVSEAEALCVVIWEDYPEIRFETSVRCGAPGTEGTLHATIVVEQKQR